MPTKRVPLNRQHQSPVTERAVRLFDAMRHCRCTCPQDRDPLTRCSACDRWWKLQNELCDELRTPVWQYPCVEDPRDGENRPAAEALWVALAQASREARREQRAARAKSANGAPDQPPLG